MSVIAAGGVAAGASALASSTFNYNRANYQYDQGGRRFARYTTGFNMAQAQTKMYREDIEDLTKMTVCKQDTYHTIGTIFFVLNFQLIMAGRLGVHGPSPPGWLLGLYWTNICSALMFLTVFTWMAMHASARAQAGGAFLRTRNIRLPIPSPKQLDKARTTGNTFEKQRVGEMFRVPIVMPPPTDKDNPERDADDTPQKVPRWYQTDEVDMLYDGENGPLASGKGNPEHFELHRGLQEEWWGYDIYTRIGVCFFMSHWLQSASLYSMCHVFTELRCVWPAWTVVACFVAAHYGILQLDIVQPKGGLAVEKYVPMVPFFAVAAMSIDYSVLNPSAGATLVVYVLAWCGYILQMAWALRLYDLAKPRCQQDVKEVPGRPWTPGDWPMPTAFMECAYIVSAPKKLPDDQTCLLQELKAGKGCKEQRSPARKMQQGEPSLHAWKLFRGACITTICMWVLIIFGRAFETFNGERQLLKQENRVERWPSHIQPWMSPWSRFGSRNEWCHAGGCDRRLSQDQAEVAQMAQKLISVLNPVVHAFQAQSAPQAAPAGFALPQQLAEVAWPEGLVPEHLAARDEDNLVAALARNRRGAMFKVLEPAAGGRVAELAPFALHGLEEELGEVRGGTFSPSGLMLTMQFGDVAECTGLPVQGTWSCHRLGPRLPTFGASLRSAVASRVAGSDRLRAAVAMAEEGASEEEATLLLLEAAPGLEAWAPVGEVRLPVPGDRARLSLSPSAEAVFVSSERGEVLEWPFGVAEPRVQVPAAQGGSSTARWHASCPMGGGQHLVHLATQAFETAPKLYVRAAAASTSAAL